MSFKQKLATFLIPNFQKSEYNNEKKVRVPIVILRSVSNLYNTWKFSFFKYLNISYNLSNAL